MKVRELTENGETYRKKGGDRERETEREDNSTIKYTTTCVIVIEVTEL